VWLAFAALEALLCLGPATIVGRLFYYAPGFANFQAPLRHLFLMSLCLSVVSGLAVAAIQREQRGRARLAVAIVVAVVIAVGVQLLVSSTMPAAVGLRASNATYTTWSFGWPVVVALAALLCVGVGSLLPHRRAGWIALVTMLVLVQVGDMLAVHYRVPGRRFAYSDVRREETMPDPHMATLGMELRRTGQRALASDGSKNAFLLPNLPRAWEIPAASGSGWLALVRYLEVLGMDTAGAVSNESLSENNHGADLFGVQYVLVRQGSDAAATVKNTARWQLVEDLRRDESDPDTYYSLFRNTRALPRAWCGQHVVPVDRDQMFAAIREGNLPDGTRFEPLRDVLVDAGGSLPAQHATHHRAPQVQFDTDRPGRYQVNAAVPCLLVVSEVAYPWWRASLDGSATRLLTVNHVMLGVVIPPGQHVVELRLQPTSVWIGGAISGFGLLGLAAVVLLKRPA
jgi:hypothetical protein